MEGGWRRKRGCVVGVGGNFERGGEGKYTGDLEDFWGGFVRKWGLVVGFSWLGDFSKRWMDRDRRLVSRLQDKSLRSRGLGIGLWFDTVRSLTLFEEIPGALASGRKRLRG